MSLPQKKNRYNYCFSRRFETYSFHEIGRKIYLVFFGLRPLHVTRPVVFSFATTSIFISPISNSLGCISLNSLRSNVLFFQVLLEQRGEGYRKKILNIILLILQQMALVLDAKLVI